MFLIDTHAHLDDDQFEGDRDGVVRRAGEAKVTGIVAVGTTAASSLRCIELAAQYPIVHASVGIQPNYCAEASSGDWDRVVQLARRPEVVALGETGLDQHWDYTPFDLQRDYFDRHLRFSQQVQLPVIIHMRDCGPELLEMLRQARRRGPVSGVMHAFTGDGQLAAECVELGLSISFAGMVTYKKSHDLRAVAAAVPDDRILIETDAPYLSPHPHRGQRPNEPARLVHTAQCLAEVRGVSREEFSALSAANARRQFALKD
jgi:TatD DNase family protein